MVRTTRQPCKSSCQSDEKNVGAVAPSVFRWQCQELFGLNRLEKSRPYFDEKLSNQGRRQHAGCAVHGSYIIGRAIRHERLQALQHYRERHEDSPDQERPGPSEAAHQGYKKIAGEVVEFPAISRAWLPFRRA